MTTPKEQHTFIVPAYGDSPYLEACLDSLTQQSVKSQIIITTATPSSTLRDLADRFHANLIINKKQEGLAADWNFAVSTADSEYLTLAHQDDCYQPDYTETMLREIDGDDSILIAFSRYNVIDDNDQQRDAGVLLLIKLIILLIFFPIGNRLKNPWLRKYLVSVGNPICCPSVTYHRTVFEKLQFDKSFQVNVDWKFWIDLANIKGRYLYVKHPLMAYRAHDLTTTRQAIASGSRREEDYRCYRLIWPAPIARLIAAAYRLSYRTKS